MLILTRKSKKIHRMNYNRMLFQQKRRETGLSVKRRGSQSDLKGPKIT